MSSGAYVGRTVTHAAMCWWRARHGQMPSNQPPEVISDHRLADAVLARADPASAGDQVHRDMLRMMWHFSVDPAQVPLRFWGVLRDAERICAQCLFVGRCQRWSHERASDDAPRSFCPNAELYEEIAASQRQTLGSDESPTV